MSDDQDATAPGRVSITIKRVEVVADDPDRFVHSLNKAIARELAAPAASVMGWPQDEGRWVRVLSMNLSWAGVEEMRVRAAMLRLVREAPCSSCGAASTSVECATPGCRFAD